MKLIHYFFKMFPNMKWNLMTWVPNPIIQLSYPWYVFIHELIKTTYCQPLLHCCPVKYYSYRDTYNQAQTIFKLRAYAIILLLSTICELKQLSLKLNCILHDEPKKAMLILMGAGMIIYWQGCASNF